MRRIATVLVALAVAAVAAVAAVDAVRGEGERVATTAGEAGPDTVAAGELTVPAGALRVAARIPVDRPAGVALAAGSLWVASGLDGTVVRIDPLRDTVVDRIEIDSDAAGLVAVDGRLLVLDERGGDAVPIVGETGEIEPPIQLPGSSLGIAFAGGDVWVSEPGRASVARIDPATGRVAGRVTAPGPAGIASTGDAVWVISPEPRIVSRIDSQTNLVEPVRLDEVPDEIVAGSSGVWVGHTAAGALTRLDPATGAVVARIELDTEPLLLAAGDGALWVLGLAHLIRIDPATNRAAASLPLELARRPGPDPYVVGGLVAGEGAVWIADTSGGEVLRIATG